MLEEEMLEKKIWAVVGANQDPEKYGNRIYRKLKRLGYEVYPVNPMYEVIEGDTCYKDLSSLPVVPEVVNMVVSPKRGRAFVDEAAKIGIKYIWLQPGTHDDELMEQVEKSGLQSVKACVLVAAR